MSFLTTGQSGHSILAANPAGINGVSVDEPGNQWPPSLGAEQLNRVGHWNRSRERVTER